jgi:hypothetical protein
MMTIIENPTSSKGSKTFCLEAFCAALPQWAERIQMRVEQSIGASDQNLGHLEELVLKDTKEIQRKAVEEAAQKKAEGTPPRCPCCGNLLRRVTTGHARSFETRFGSISIRRARGYCKRCHKWRFPADAALGLAETAGYSPSVQEMAALGVSKLPVAEAEMVIERLAGVKIPRATLDREAKRQGEQAQQLRQQMDEKAQTPEGAAAVNRAIQMELPLEAFTLVIMIDTWNIRERDEWGQSEKLRKKGLEPSRWHWVYNATVFRLPDRVRSAGERPIILSRGYVTTRWGIDTLRSQLYAEAVRRGLHHAKQVLIVADGAVWIWNLAEDRFPQARQQLDLFHAKQHLWTVAHELHGSGSAQAAAWVEPLLKQLEEGQAPRVIDRLEEMLRELPESQAKVVGREVEYFKNNRHRMDYRAAKKRGEPLGSGAIESTCRQYQCRFKRPGQFWSTQGDEAIMCLETFWRNGRWNQLFPHVGDFDPSKN